MNIKDIETSIIEKLKSEFQEIPVQGFPDKPQEYVLLHPVGTLLVHYQGSKYSSSNSINYTTQDNNKEFSITVVTRNLRNNDGAYDFLDKVKKVLSGFRPIGCSKMLPLKDFFISENSGVWQYAINFSVSTMNIED